MKVMHSRTRHSRRPRDQKLGFPAARENGWKGGQGLRYGGEVEKNGDDMRAYDARRVSLSQPGDLVCREVERDECRREKMQGSFWLEDEAESDDCPAHFEEYKYYRSVAREASSPLWGW